MGLSFSQPEFLLLLPVAGGLLWYSARQSYADLSGVRRWVAWTVRVIVVLALIIALAGGQLVKRSDDMVVVFAIDSSYSVPEQGRARALQFVQEALAHRRPQDRGALVLFGRDAVVESESVRTAQDVHIASKPVPTHTNIAAALRLALGLLPPESAGKVVLFSDGNENVGSAAGEALLAQANRVPVDVVLLQARATKDVLVREVIMPSEARRGEPFAVRVTTEATQPAETTLTVLVDDKPVEQREVTMGAGITTLRVPVSIPEAGFHRIDVLLDSPDEQCRENDRGSGFVRIRGKPRVLLMGNEVADARALRKGLQLQDIVVDVGGPASLPTNAADLERYDSVFLTNYPAYKMNAHQMTMFRDATRDLGIGLGMIGGELSFGAGGYYQTPIEEALPVSMDVTKHRIFPASAVLLVMDTSGSMGMLEDGVQKIELAAEAACAVVDLLQPYDSVGFIASDPTPTTVCRLRKVQNRASLKRDIRSVRAGGGGIASHPSLSAAYGVLRKDDSPVRHIILLADGSDCDQQGGAVQLVGDMAAEKITTTAVAFGDGPHVPFLKDVARAGRGQYYLTTKARDLKKILTRETLTVAKSVLVEEEFLPRLADTSAVTRGVEWGAVPPLLGYVATSAKSLARVPLVSHKDDPLLAHWQYGLGRSIAFTSDAKAHWAAYWLGWQEFPRFWSQAVRWSLRQLASGVLYPQVQREGDAARIVVEAMAEDGTLLNGLELRAHVDLPDGTREEVVLGQAAPGRYEGTVTTPVDGAYVVGLAASGPEGFHAEQTLGFAVAYPPDFADTRTNETLLASLAAQTGGKVLTRPEEVFQPPAVVPRVPIDIWRALLWLAALLLPLDVAVRRVVVTREDLAALAEPIRAAAARLRGRAIAKEPSTVGRLLAWKTAKPDRAEEPPRREIEVGQTEPPLQPSPTTPPAEAEQEPAESTMARLLKRKRQQKDRER